jgi:hypothetical protein
MPQRNPKRCVRQLLCAASTPEPQRTSAQLEFNVVAPEERKGRVSSRKKTLAKYIARSPAATARHNSPISRNACAWGSNAAVCQRAQPQICAQPAAAELAIDSWSSAALGVSLSARSHSFRAAGKRPCSACAFPASCSAREAAQSSALGGACSGGGASASSASSAPANKLCGAGRALPRA